jgi:hypothetical protein
MGICQEKFQVEFAPLPDDNGHKWVSDRSARVKKGMPGREGRKGGDPSSTYMNNNAFFQGLPPGSDITDQETTDQRVQDLKGPFGNGTQVTNDLTQESVRKGYDHKSMRPTDDMYTNEHCDAFYGEARVDGEVGFIERNNNLDRL